MVSLSPFFQTAVIGWGEAGKQNHWEKARPAKGLTRGNGAGAVNPGGLCMDPAERAKLRLFCSLPAVLGSRWTELFGRMEKRRDHAQAGRVHRVLRSGDLSGPVSAAGEASSARGGSFLCRGLPRPAAAGTLAEAGVAGGHGAGPGPGVELAVQLCCTGASCGPVRQRGHRFHDSFGVRRPHGLRRQGDSEAGGGSPGQGGLLRRGGPAGPGAGPDGGGTGEISGFRPASGGYHYQLHRSGSVPAGLPAGRRSRLR